MKKQLQGILIGILLCAMVTTAYAAAPAIKSAMFNSNKITYNGQQINLNSNPMITVIKQGEKWGSNYMPVRTVLEALGYTVNWDGTTNTVVITDEPTTAPVPTPSVQVPTEKWVTYSGFSFAVRNADSSGDYFILSLKVRNDTGKACKDAAVTVTYADPAYVAADGTITDVSKIAFTETVYIGDMAASEIKEVSAKGLKSKITGSGMIYFKVSSTPTDTTGR